MARRWTDPAAFRPNPVAGESTRPSRRQSVALLAVLVLIAGAIAVVSYAVRPDRARSFDLLHGSVLIADQFGPVDVDLASGKGTLQIRGAAEQAGAKSTADLSVVPFDGGTLLLNRSTGEFNMVDSTGFVLKRDGGVTIPGRSDSTSALGVAAGQYSYIERTGASGTDVLLVGLSTVQRAANTPTGVTTATSGTATVRPRAAYSTGEMAATTAGSVASANGNLWTLLRTSTGTAVTEFALPAGSSTGARLTRTGHGTVATVAAIESATTGTGGSGADVPATTGSGTDGQGPDGSGSDSAGTDVVGVASQGRIRLYSPKAATRTVSYRTPAGTDSILPTSNAQGRLTYLLHATGGWSVLSVGVDGTGLVGPVALGTIAPDADLAPPAASDGAAYTMLRNGMSGTVYRIAPGGSVTAAASGYPQTERNGRSVEGASFADASLIARGPRVIANSPAHYLALTLFTDGSHAPQVIRKTNLTSVNAAAGADALTRGLPGGVTSKSKPPRSDPPVRALPQVDPRINCSKAGQKPHIPSLASPLAAARSVGLSWLYPPISAQDCIPTTYVVTLSLVGDTGPSAPGSVTVRGRTDTIVTGLFPDTTYEVRVAAVIGRQSTQSLPVRFTTGPEGPAPPDALTVAADAAGSWTLAWSGCGNVDTRCVPAETWTVLPSFCDARGVSASPAPVTVQGDPTSVKQAPYTFAGGEALLGRGLRFRVQGKGADGTLGSPTAASACVYSYAQPDTTGMTLSASRPDVMALGGSTTTTVTLDLGATPLVAVGGVGATVQLVLTGDGGAQTKSFVLAGPQSTVSAAFTGLRAGAVYEATAVVTSAHGGLSARTAPQAVTASSGWPASTDQGGSLGIVASCPQALLSCTLDISFGGLASSQVRGERFRLVQSSDPRTSSAVTCANGVKQLSGDGIDPGTDHIRVVLSQLELFYGACQVRVVLVEDASSAPLVFGGVPSPLLTTDVDLGAPQTAGSGTGDFAASFSGASATLTYTGSNALIGALSTNWHETLLSPGGQECGENVTDSAPVAGRSHTIVASAACLRQDASHTGWVVRVSYDNTLGGGTNGPFTASIATSPYGPCNPTSLRGTWERGNGQVDVDYTGDRAAIDGCPGQSWLFTLIDPAGNPCGQPSNGTSNPGGSVVIPVTCATTASPGWQIRLDYTDQVGNAQAPITFVAEDPSG